MTWYQYQKWEWRKSKSQKVGRWGRLRWGAGGPGAFCGLRWGSGGDAH